MEQLTPYVWMPLGCMDMLGREWAHPTPSETTPRFLHIQLRSVRIITSAYAGCCSMNWRGSAALICITSIGNTQVPICVLSWSIAKERGIAVRKNLRNCYRLATVGLLLLATTSGM